MGFFVHLDNGVTYLVLRDCTFSYLYMGISEGGTSIYFSKQNGVVIITQ